MGAEGAEGARRLADTIGQAADALHDWTPVYDDVADVLAARAAPGTPRDTGELANKLRATVTQTTAVVTDDARHAVFVHGGTRRMKARPWIADAAADALDSDVLPILARHAQTALDNVTT